jgi:serine/threonine protein kinase
MSPNNPVVPIDPGIDYKRLKSAFLQARDLGYSERHEFLREFAKTHPELLEHLNGLLSAHQASTLEVAGQGRDADPVNRHSEIETDYWPIPDYVPVSVCGRGAYGVVWMVRDKVGVYRALKIIDVDRLARLGVECREKSALEAYCKLVRRHRHLIQVFHVGSAADCLYYTMELADDDRSGKPVTSELPSTYRPLTLESVLGRVSSVRLDTAMIVVIRLLRGLSTLHRAGLAHRDIKPANIVFVDRAPKLADIGLMTTNILNPSSIGTPAYMPPDGQMDLTADTYAMGRLLLSLLGTKPSRQWPPDMPPALQHPDDDWDTEAIWELLKRACADRAQDRFSNADQMLEEISACRVIHLLDELEAGAVPADASKINPYLPALVAAIHVLPWVLGILCGTMLISRFL